MVTHSEDSAPQMKIHFEMFSFESLHFQKVFGLAEISRAESFFLLSDRSFLRKPSSNLHLDSQLSEIACILEGDFLRIDETWSMNYSDV